MNNQHESATHEHHRNYNLIATIGVLAVIAIVVFAKMALLASHDGKFRLKFFSFAVSSM